MFSVEVVQAHELGNASFFVATDRQAFVIDPVRDIERYLELAHDRGVTITHALDTHLHNDFVSGARELAAEAGSAITPVDAGGEVTAGEISLKALHAPGHTPDHKSYLLSEQGRPRALFSGGAVMLGAIARTDLFGPHLAVHLALEAMSTLQVRLRGLPDDVAVYATHGSGSFCGIGSVHGSDEPSGDS